MKITLTAAQAAELTNPFWDIPFTVTVDGENYKGNIKDDDPALLCQLTQIGTPALTSSGDLEIYHPGLNWEDEVLVKALLDERAAITEEIRQTPKADRPARRKKIRSELRAGARRDARVARRVALRREERRMARMALRADMRVKFRAKLEQARPQED